MSAQTRNIVVNVKNETGTPLAEVAITLMGTDRPQFQISDASGNCTFSGLFPGSYVLLAALSGLNTKSIPVKLAATGDSTVTIQMSVVESEGNSAKDKFFRILTGLQYLFLASLALVASVLLYRGLTGANLDLSNTESARGMITFVVAIVTVSIALILVMAAFLSGGKDVDKRFASGKEVFTILIGVLGTVMGFYYGQAKPVSGATTTEERRATLQVTAPQLTTAAKVGGEFTLAATIAGGEKPYTYTVTFDKPDVFTPAAANVDSEDGKISRKFTVAKESTLVGQTVGYKIEVMSKNGLRGTLEKGAIKLEAQ